MVSSDLTKIDWHELLELSDLKTPICGWEPFIEALMLGIKRLFILNGLRSHGRSKKSQ